MQAGDVRIWAPMLVAPLLALAQQSIAYALVTPLCSRQAGGWLHALSAAFVLATVALTGAAWQEMRRTDAAPLNRRFLARVAVGVAAVSVIALLAMWIPQWLVPVCQP